MVDKLATATNQFKENKVWQVILDKVHIKKQVNRVNIWGYSLNTKDLHRYRRGRTFKVNELKRYNEVVIDDLVGRIRLCANTLNLRLPPSASPTWPHAIRMLCTSSDKGILKTRGGSGSGGGGGGGGYSRTRTLSNRTLTTPTKSVSFNNTIYISPITTRHYEPTSSTTVKNYESMYKEYLQKVQMNGACSATNQTATTTTTTATAGSTIITTTTTSIAASSTTTATITINNNNNNNTTTTTTTTTTSTGAAITTAVNNTNTTTNNTATTASSPSVRTDTTTTTTTTMAVDISDESPPKRKRGRPKGSGIRRREEPVLRTPPTIAATVAAAATEPSPVSPVRKRGWPLGVPRKGYSAAKGFAAAKNYTPAKSYSGVKGKRGRPRKLPEFNFHSIVSDIKTIELPSELWSAHVSVTAKRSQVCFTRVVQALSSTVPVECDRSVKFNGSLKHLVRINNRDVELLGAPPAVHSIQDIQTLLQIVDDISINDPVLDYMHR